MTNLDETNNTSLTQENIREFFDTFIKLYAPYQEEKVYNTLINNLTEYFYQHAYTTIPSELKQVFETTDFESEILYNKLLIAVGVPEEIINNITIENKIIFLRTLSDFMRYKGTVTFFQKVSEAFNDQINIYELYIDKIGTEWFFKPVKIYIRNDIDEYLQPIPYSIIYEKVASLIINEAELNTLYDAEKLILPIKSNIVMLNNTAVQYASLLNNVILSIFLYTYRSEYINIYFSNDTVKPIILKNVYFLWYYLVTKYYGISWNEIDTSKASIIKVLRFIYSDQFPTFIGNRLANIENLQYIIDEYNNIEIQNDTTRDYDNTRTLQLTLYNKISDAFNTTESTNEVTFTQMYNELSILNSDMLNYVSQRIEDSSLTEREEINLILREIYLSLQLYATEHYDDGYFFDYSSYFLTSLFQILVKPEETVTYTILYNLKPYHVDFYNNTQSVLYVQDNFNKVCVDDETGLTFLSTVKKASVITVGEDVSHQVEKTTVSDVVCYDYYEIGDVVDISDLYFKYDEEFPLWVLDNVLYTNENRLKSYFIL
jgi:hypothetical protein